MKERWSRALYVNPKTGGMVLVERDKRKIYISFNDEPGGYTIDGEMRDPNYDGVTPVVLGIWGVVMALWGVLVVLRVLGL